MTVGVDPEPTEWLSGRLDDRIVALLESNPGHLAFNGLRRALHAHPESLQRALRRLERDGVVRRDVIGYALSAYSPTPPTTVPRPEHEVATIELPPDTEAEPFLGRLAGRWVGPLRWVGLLDDPDHPRLVWAVPGSPGQVVAAVRDGRLRVTVETPLDPIPADLRDAAHELVVFAVREARHGRRESPPSVATLTPSAPPPTIGNN